MSSAINRMECHERVVGRPLETRDPGTGTKRVMSQCTARCMRSGGRQAGI